MSLRVTPSSLPLPHLAAALLLLLALTGRLPRRHPPNRRRRLPRPPCSIESSGYLATGGLDS